MSGPGQAAVSMLGSFSPLAVFATIALPAPMAAGLALSQGTATAAEAWGFLTAFGVAAAPVGIGLAIAAHVLGKRLGSLVSRIDRVTLSRERYISQYELPSLNSLLTKAIQKFEETYARMRPEHYPIGDETALKTLSHLHAVRAAIIDARLPKINGTDPLQEIDYAINTVTFSDVGQAKLLELVGVLKSIRAAVWVRMGAPASEGGAGARRMPRRR
ncbi:MAG: hypothetical protein OXU37_08710 [Thaumarchaeota archaeon]|nr:hypothetical protein [Nitrososphaerota archaeon]